jgi:hypothetical protein
MKAKKNISKVGGVKDFVKAVKIADREMGLGNGFVAIHKVHKSRKAYDRNKEKRIIF